MSSPDTNDSAKTAPFGAENRQKLIGSYFDREREPAPDTAWKLVYGLLLWIDSTTGLAHCYESDKAQPGKNWYARTLAFHRWLAAEFGTTALDLKLSLDRLFREALGDYLVQIEARRAALAAKAETDRAGFAPESFPFPGSEPEAEKIILEMLAPFFSVTPPADVLERLACRLREYWKQENKRKNLLGEGFEDVLAAVVSKIHPRLRVRTRASISAIDGFYAPGARDKATKVDLVVEHAGWPRPILVNVKWSVRADREDQLWDDFHEFVRFDRDGRGFDHFLLTNEFDPARLNALCDRRQANSHVFKHVVHIAPAGLLAAYGPAAQGSRKSPSSFRKVTEQIASGRLIGLCDWLSMLNPEKSKQKPRRPRAG